MVNDELEQLEKGYLSEAEFESSEEESSLGQEDIEDRRQDRSERKKYANQTFVFVSIFTGLMMMIIVFTGFSFWGFKLSDSILITLITSSLTTVIGIFILVVQYLFKK